MFLTFLQLQLKRTLKQLPFLLIGAMLLLTLTGSIAFLASRKLYGDAITDVLHIGYSSKEDSDANRMFIDTLQNQSTLKQMTRFEAFEEQAGRAALARGEIQALIVMPEGFLGGIISGRNEPALILLNQDHPLEARLLRTLTEAGARSLSVSQGALYATYDVYQEQGRTAEQQSAMNLEINERFLNLSLARDRLFDQQTVQATGDIPVMVYYVASFSLLFLLLMGMLQASVVKPFHLDLRRKLRVEGVSEGAQLFSVWICLFLIHALLVILLAVLLRFALPLAGIETFRLSASSVAQLLFLAMATTSFVLFVYRWNEDLLSGMLMLFALSLGLLFLSGGFLPSSFLGREIRAIQWLLPTTHWMKWISSTLLGQTSVPILLYTIGSAIVFYLLALGRSLYKGGVR